MTLEPDILLENFFRLTPVQKSALKKLKIATARDLLYHFPVRYQSAGALRLVRELVAGEHATISGTISRIETLKTFRRKVPATKAVLTDETGSLTATWLHQPYLAAMLREGTPVRLTGKVSSQGGRATMFNPEVERVAESERILARPQEERNALAPLFPVYPESRGVSSRWIFYAVHKLFEQGILAALIDPLPEDLLRRYHLPALQAALRYIHAPKSERHSTAARKRFAFEEVFYIQLGRQRERRTLNSLPAFKIEKTAADLADFLSRLPFALTRAQQCTIEAVRTDFRSGRAMSRLLEGDVGSGKTAVAAAAAYAALTSRPASQDFGNLQVAYMAPTETLAKQHFVSFIEYFSHRPISLGLITAGGCKKFPSKTRPDEATALSRAQLLRWVANGEIAILIGTHALIQKSVRFRDLALIIIDEQHKFGVSQRAALVRRSPQNVRGSSQNAPTDTHNLIYEKITYTLRGVAFTVKNALGPGHKEIIYQNAFEEELKKGFLPYEREKQLPVFYNKKRMGSYQPDFLVDDKIIIEMKALPRLSEQNKKQTWNYLKGTDYRLALLINFGSRELEIQRIIFDNARDRPREATSDSHISDNYPRRSASDPHLSAQQMRLPHLLSMTATPIPRTLALTIYGDLDLTLLDEMPLGRKPVLTEILVAAQREKAYERMHSELAAGRQCYVICPRIDEPDPDKALALQAKSVKEEARRLSRDIFTQQRIEVLHGALTPAVREKTMRQFAMGELHILVATSVVEVGVNVPNATVILIEGAERFGLAQLHQLRGRVLRSADQAYCFALTESRSKAVAERLRALKTAKNGFELAELDLKIRGPGELAGSRQWGLSDVGMEALKNLKMVEAARTEAARLIEEDPELTRHPMLRAIADEKQAATHFE